MHSLVRAFFLSCFIGLVMGFAAYPITEFLNKAIFHVASFATNYNFFTLGVVTGFLSSYSAFVIQVVIDSLDSRKKHIAKESKS